MELAVYAHPFDLTALAAEGGLARLVALGIGEVALATSYHDGRWLMPWHPAGMVRQLEDGCVHFQPAADYGMLQPRPSSSVRPGQPSPLAELCAAAPARGLRVRAWTVGTHCTRLGLLHPELCVQNARGDRYCYALCPSQPAVQRYLVGLATDLAAHAGLATIEFEAFAQMGWKHSSHHDKASFQPAGLLDAALSSCWCAACAQRQRDLGHDPEPLRRAVQELLRQQLTDGCAMAPTALPRHVAELGAAGEPPWLRAVLAVRAAVVRQLAASLVTATPNLRRAIQVHPEPWFTGSQVALASAAGWPPADERVLTCYGDGPAAIARTLAAVTAALPAPVALRVCIWPKAPQFTGAADLRQLREACAQYQVESLAIYHLGLLPWRTLEQVATMFAA